MTLTNPQDVIDKFICYERKDAKYPALFLDKPFIGAEYVLQALRPGNLPIITKLEETDANGDPVCIELDIRIKNCPENFMKLLKLTEFDIQINKDEFIHVSNIKQLMDDTRYTWT